MRLVAKFLTVAFVLGACVSLALAEEAKAPENECTSIDADRYPERLEVACTRVLARSDLTDEERAEAHYLRGFGRYRAQRNQAAIGEFDKGLALTPGHNRLHRLKSAAALRLGDTTKAFHHIRRAIELYPQGSEEYFVLAKIYIALGQNEKALASLNTAIERKEEHIWARYDRAVLLTNKNDHEGALKDTEWLMKVEPEALEWLGTAYVLTTVVPVYPAIRARHAYALLGLGRYKEGERVVAELAANHPSPFTVMLHGIYLGRLPVGVGFPNRTPEAIELLMTAVKLDPNYSNAWRYLAIYLDSSNRHEEALAANERAFRTNKVPAYVPELLWERARTMRMLGRTEQAVNVGTAAMAYAFRLPPRFRSGLFMRLRARGYWRSAELPTEMNQDVIDATTACFHDPACM